MNDSNILKPHFKKLDEPVIEKAKPFLRWAGGKKWMIKHLPLLNPKNINNYHEVFLGSASTFFSLEDGYYKNAFLSDINEDLINAYLQIRDNYDGLLKALKTFKNTEKFYYSVREKLVTDDPVYMAARMLYLNKTGFNGIYRVNSKGLFNVPYGHRKNIEIVDEKNLLRVSKILSAVTICVSDFEVALDNVQPGDFVFIDPPYTVAHENNGFIEYNKNLFSLDDQIRLSNAILRLSQRGGKYILTNAKHAKILEIYKQLGRPKILKRHSHVGGIGAVREEVKEYVFTNCI